MATTGVARGTIKRRMRESQRQEKISMTKLSKRLSMPVPTSSDNCKLQYFKLIDQLRCRVCLQNQANILLLPCRHLTLCTQCAPYQPEDTCPKCRQEYDVMIDFFWGDEEKKNEDSTTLTIRNQDNAAEPDQSQAQTVSMPQRHDFGVRELEFGTDLRLLFNQII